MRTRIAVVAAGLAAAVTLAFAGPTAAFADSNTQTDNNVTATDVAAALTGTTDVLGNSDSVTTTSDTDSAATTQVNGTTVDVPKDASAGVDLTNNGVSLTVTPPNADDSGTGKVVAPGVVAYSATNGAATAVQATNDGGLRMATVIDNANAPTRYPYAVQVPDGASIALTDGGGAVVVAADGAPLYSIAQPWAHDANQTDVPTHFELDGNNLVQVVDHTSGDYAYPVTADPFWSALGNYLGCIFGVGVPIGMAFVIAALPASWPFLLRWGYQQQAQGDRTIINYLYRVHNACSRFIWG